MINEGLSGDAHKWWRDEMGPHYRLEGLEYGAAAAFGLMCMFYAIRDNPSYNPGGFCHRCRYVINGEGHHPECGWA